MSTQKITPNNQIYTISAVGTGGSGGNTGSAGGGGSAGQLLTAGYNGIGQSDILWTSTIPVSNPMTVNQTGTIELRGENADLIINGQGLKETLNEIKEALRIPNKLQRDENLEKNWDELRLAAEHYNKLLKEYKEKQQVWNTLKDQDL